MILHSHPFKFESKNQNIHIHKIAGSTDTMLGIHAIHFHLFYGISSYNTHTHYFSGITGLPIKTKNGHVHKMEGFVDVTHAHNHAFLGETFEDVGYITNKREREAYV